MIVTSVGKEHIRSVVSLKYSPFLAYSASQTSSLLDTTLPSLSSLLAPLYFSQPRGATPLGWWGGRYPPTYCPTTDQLKLSSTMEQASSGATSLSASLVQPRLPHTPNHSMLKPVLTTHFLVITSLSCLHWVFLLLTSCST